MSKRIVSLILALMLAIGMFAIPVAYADEPGEDITLRLRYLFNGNYDDTQRDQLTATPGSGSGISFVEDEQFGTVLSLAGGANSANNYLQIPGRAFEGVESMTVSSWMYLNSTGSYRRLFDFGRNSTYNFWFMPNTTALAAITTSGSGGEYRASGTQIARSGWHHVAVSLDAQNKTLSVYVDGVRIAHTTNVPLSFADIRSSTASSNRFYIGKSQYSDNLLDAKLYDFRVYDVAKDEAGVAAIMAEALSDQSKVESVARNINIGTLNNRTDNFNLPTEGLNGTSITWTSSDNAVIDPITGVVTRPAYTYENDAATVTLTATVTLNDAETTKDFVVTVPRLPSPQELVEADKEALDLGDLSALKEDITLPVVGKLGSTITWSSTNSAISADGTVTRPASTASNAKGKLTATISYGTNDGDKATVTKEFDFTVLRMETNEELVAMDAAAIDLGDLKDRVDDLDLITVGASGKTTITWISYNTDIIATNGTVTRPASTYFRNSAVVELKAKVTCGDAVTTRTFTVAVPRNSKALKLVDVADIEATTEVGYLPELPYYIEGTYVDDAGNPAEGVDVRVNWYGYETGAGTNSYSTNPPTDAKAFSNVGDIIRVKGYVPTIDGERYEVVANVTVVAATEKEAPTKDIEAFGLSDVTIDNYENGNTPVFKRNQNAFITKLANTASADSFLYMFRYTFGEDNPKGTALGGWDTASTKLRGHATGHYLTAISQAYADTATDADQTTHKKLGDTIEYVIDELYRLSKLSQGDPTAVPPQTNPPSANVNGYASNISGSGRRTDYENWGEGYISAYPPDQFIMLEYFATYSSTDSTIWAPYYTLHKILAGLIDCYEVAGNEKALEIAEGMGSWVAARLASCTQAQLNRMWNIYIAGEYGGMNETMAALYGITGNEDFLQCAKNFDNAGFFYGPVSSSTGWLSDNKSGLANNIDTIRTRHANQHIPQIVGAIKTYEVSGEYKYYEVADNFWDMVNNSYTYSIGGVAGRNANVECFADQPNVLGTTLHDDNNNMCETCATYNMLKLSRQLFMFSGDTKYMDYYEQAWYNQIAASTNETTGNTYHIPLDGGSVKSFGNANMNGFTCCNGTAIESNTKLQDSVYFKAADNSALYVNLYAPSTLTWDNVTVKQVTNFPYDDSSKITINGGGNFDVMLRIPSWATSGYTIKVNGTAIDVDAEPGSYVSAGNVWKNGDVIEIELPFSFYLNSMMDSPNKASIFYGPILLAGTESSSLSALRKITLEAENIGNSISGDPSTLTFKVEGESFTLQPFWNYDTASKRYSVYYDVSLDDIPEYDIPLEVSTDKTGYKANEDILVSMVVPTTVSSVEIYNEYDKAIGKSLVSITPNGDGTMTMVYKTSLGTKGTRELYVVLNEGFGSMKSGTVSVKIGDYETVDNTAAAINDAYITDGVKLAMVNQTFSVTVKTTTGVSGLNFYNETGKAMGKTLVSRTVEGNTVTWVYNMSIGTKGSPRVISIKPVDASITELDQAATVEINIVK